MYVFLNLFLLFVCCLFVLSVFCSVVFVFRGVCFASAFSSDDFFVLFGFMIVSNCFVLVLLLYVLSMCFVCVVFLL